MQIFSTCEPKNQATQNYDLYVCRKHTLATNPNRANGESEERCVESGSTLFDIVPYKQNHWNRNDEVRGDC